MIGRLSTVIATGPGWIVTGRIWNPVEIPVVSDQRDNLPT
jgi:hypothetical protein